MSQFNRKGFREEKKKREIREQVEHLNGFYNILDQLENTYQELIKEGKEPVTKDNIKQLSSEVMGRDLDWIELRVLSGKLGIDIKKEDYGS